MDQSVKARDKSVEICVNNLNRNTAQSTNKVSTESRSVCVLVSECNSMTPVYLKLGKIKHSHTFSFILRLTYVLVVSDDMYFCSDIMGHINFRTCASPSGCVILIFRMILVPVFFYLHHGTVKWFKRFNSQISWNLEATRLSVEIIISLWNLPIHIGSSQGDVC